MNTFAVLLPVALVGLTQWLMPALAPPTIPFGVRVPRDRADAPVVAGQRRTYRIATAVVAVVAVVATAGAVPAGRPWAGPAAVGAELIAGVLLYLRARARITAVKQAEDWFGGRRQVSVADTSLHTDPEPYPWLWALPAVALTAATVVTGIVAYPRLPSRLAVHYGLGGHPDRWAATSVTAAFGPVLAQVAVTLLLLAVAGLALRSRARLDAEDPNAATRHRRFVAAITRALLALAGCMSVTFLFDSLRTWDLIHPPAAAWTALNVVPPLLGAAALLVVAVRMGQEGSRLRLAGTARESRTVNRDDDRFYRLGLFYFNRDDPAVLVPKRFGVGWTLNLAHPATWLIFAAVLAVGLIGVIH